MVTHPAQIRLDVELVDGEPYPVSLPLFDLSFEDVISVARAMRDGVRAAGMVAEITLIHTTEETLL
jgi:hypothetical protein